MEMNVRANNAKASDPIEDFMSIKARGRSISKRR